MAFGLKELIANLKEKEAISLVETQLKAGADPLLLMAEAREGLKLVGDNFAKGMYFIPDLVYSGEILKRIAEMVQPFMKKGPAEKKVTRGKVIVGTVEGDIHDIGKDMVVFMLDTSGFEVIDLGIDVPPQKFVDAIKESGAKVVGLSGFLTLAFDAMKATVDAIGAAGLRDKVKIMIGGGQIDEEILKYTKADAYGLDANDAIKMSGQWIGG